MLLKNIAVLMGSLGPGLRHLAPDLIAHEARKKQALRNSPDDELATQAAEAKRKRKSEKLTRDANRSQANNRTA